MKINAKFIVIAILSGLATILSAATNIKKAPDEHYTNLQVLPKDISPPEMNKVMVDDFEDALGVACGYCHASKKDVVGELDFASDAKPEKQIARLMLRMTLNVNHDYFKIDTPRIGTANVVVTCNTCHKGETFPDDNDSAKN